MRIFPASSLGRWGAVLAALWPLCTIVGTLLAQGVYKGVEAGDGLFADLLVRPWLASIMLFGIGGGVVSFAINGVAIRRGERSIVSFAALAIGAFLAFLLLGEIFFPNH